MITSIVAILAALCASIAPGTTGWRFEKGNICVLDQTTISDGVWRAAVAWSKAPDINLIWARNCSAYPQSQTITVTTSRWDASTGCDVVTVAAYLGLVTKTAVRINLNCNTYAVEDRANLAAKPLGMAVGLAELTPGNPLTVMSSAWLPTDRDYQLVEQIYPW